MVETGAASLRSRVRGCAPSRAGAAIRLCPGSRCDLETCCCPGTAIRWETVLAPDSRFRWWIGCRAHTVGTAVRKLPLEDTGTSLPQPPALGLLNLVVTAAERRQIAFAGSAAQMMRHGVIEIAAARGVAAARVGAGRLADLDKVSEASRRPVTRCLPPVPAVRGGEGLDGDLELPVGACPAGAGPGTGQLAADAAMRDSASVGTCERDAPAGARHRAQAAGQPLRILGADRAEPGDLTDAAAPIQQSAQGQGQIDRPACGRSSTSARG